VRALLATLALLAMTACESSPSVEASLAQCTIDSYGNAGQTFLKANNVANDPDAAYRNWTLLCMKAKGFGYEAQQCSASSAIGDIAFNDERCFRRM
jgi:invasion protein IalB